MQHLSQVLLSYLNKHNNLIKEIKMKSSQIISCPVCNKSKFHSRVGNCCSGCGYILEESDLQYGAVKYTTGVVFLLGLLWVLKEAPLIYLVLCVFFALLLNPTILTRIGVKKLKVKKIGMVFAYIIWIVFIFTSIVGIDWQYLNDF